MLENEGGAMMGRYIRRWNGKESRCVGVRPPACLTPNSYARAITVPSSYKNNALPLLLFLHACIIDVRVPGYT